MSEFDIGVVDNNTTYVGNLNSTDLTDIYKLNLTAGGTFNVSLSGLSDNADLFLLNSNNQIIQSSTLAGNSSETLSFQNLGTGSYSLQITSTAGSTDYLLGIQTSNTSTDVIDPLTGLPLTNNQPPTHPNFETGIFRVGETGIVSIDYLYDGGRFAGDFGLFNLAGMETLSAGSTNYIKEAARRAITNSSLGYTVISDATEGAKFGGVFTPTETDFNSGTYQGIKTFAMKPGETFGFILAPQDSLQTIFNNPGLGGGRKPLFSMGTINPNDTFYPGQITRVTDNNTGFVFEDAPVLNPGGSTDYNDLIFQIQGVTGIANSLTDYVYGGRDWRRTSNGQQIVNFINTADSNPPIIQASLANDTGENNTDKITVDPTISGTVTDSSKIFSLRARFNNTTVGAYTDVVSLTNPDGTFSLNRQQLEKIYGQTLPEGEHTLYLQAIDKYGAVSNTFNISFTLEPEIIPVTDNGGIYQFNGQVINGTLRPRQSQQFTFNIRNSEITSTASDTVLISMSVAAISSSNFQPGVPTIQGLTPLISQNNTNNSYALFAFNTAGQKTINLTGINSTTNGQYSLQLTVAGDINLDEKVDATDAQLLNQALGTTSNNTGYSLNLDINRDGVINNSDVELLNQNFGFVANTPPVIKTSNILTHQELETTIDLEKIVTDADNDSLTYSISNPVNGTLETINNSQKVFKPASNFAGIGSFNISVDDGGYKVSETININVSDAPLINLEFTKTKKQLNVGETVSLEVQGDFADAKDVVLPDSYLTYATENAGVVQVTESGDVTALAEGTSVLSVKRNNISAVTAIRAGELTNPQNQSELNVAVAELYGLDSYPDAVTLPVGGTRQLLVGLNEVQESPDLKAASSGTRYFVSDSNILNVSADGQITALKEGFATVTIIHGAAEEIIPVRVGAEVTGPATVGADGGIVKALDGSAVMIAPGALDANTNVNLTPLNPAQLSLPIPEGFQFAGGFNLEFSKNALNVPAQIAIPAPAGIQIGTKVYFMRKGALPDETGKWKPIWLQEESGIVGNDGIIRTSSPPYPGVIRPGEYMVAYSSIAGSATLVKGQLTLNYNFPLAFFGIIDPREEVGQLIEPDNFVTIPAFTVTYDISSVKVIAIPKVGLPVITEVGIQRSTDGIATFETSLNMPGSVENEATEPPILQKASLQFNDESNNPFPGGEPVLFLTGSNVLVNNGSDLKGSRFEDLIVKFYVGDEVYEGTVLPNLSQELGNNQFKVGVKVPPTVVLGVSQISISRKQNELVGQNGPQPVYEEVEYDSNKIQLNTDAGYIFTALRGADRVAVLDGTDPESVVEGTNSNNLQLASIPVGTEANTDRPRELAVTSDATRVYVVLEGSGSVALVDSMVLQQVDTNPDTPQINPITLRAGASPQSIVIDSRDEYAYIADGITGSIYVLDINPFSTTYHQVIQTIAVTSATSGLRQMAISSDGRKLFVTAPNNQIIVVNIDPKDRPSDPNSNPRKWHEIIGTVTTSRGTEGIAATPDPKKMTFTIPLNDAQGFGVLEIINDDPTNFASTTRYVSLGLGSIFDYFDVNRGVAVTVMRDASYAFVAAKNDSTQQGVESISGVQAGSNIAIIKDPLGSSPQLVAATRPIPQGLTNDLVLSNDNKYLYAAYPTLSGGGGVYVFDVEEIIKTLSNPENYQIDSLDRGTGSPFFNPAEARNATVSDFASVPIDDINPAISIAADYEIIAENRPANQFTYGVPSDTQRGPVATGGTPWGLAAATVGDWLNTTSFANTSNDLTPTLTWDFDIPDSEISEVNLFVSTFKEGSGLLPSDKVVDLSDSSILSELSAQEKQNLLSVPWNESNDFNPNRILTATWKKEAGQWYWHDGITPIAQPVNDPLNTSTRFTLPDDRTLTAGQTYHWAVSAVSNKGQKDIEIRDFKTAPVTSATGGAPFSSVTVITHGLKFLNEPPGLPIPLYDMASSIATAGGGGLMMRYDSSTGDWLPIDKQGRLLSGLEPTNYYGKPLVLLSDWSKNFESSIPDSGFTEAAADALFASLVGLDRKLGGTVEEVEGELAAKQGALFNSPLHFIGFSRGAVVTSEMIQRIGTYFPFAGGIEGSGIRDLQMTTIDPHDFDQPGLSLFGQSFRDFHEPKIQVWENVTFADNYYQTVPKLDPNLLEKTGTPSGRSIPGADIDVFLGTRVGEPNYELSRAGFSRETDPIKVGSAQVLAGQGAVHGRVMTWYNGTTNLGMKESPDQIYRRRSDGHYDYLFDRDFYNRNQTPPLNPWYTPIHTDADFTLGAVDAPWEGIGTGWFYSVLGGGKDKRPPVDMTKRVPLTFDNTPETRMRGDAPVPTVFNGNFDVTTGGNDLIKNLFGMPWAIPGWSFHNGLPMDDAVQPGLYLEDVDASSERNNALSLGKATLPGVFGIPTSVPPLNEIVHNRLIAPKWAKTLLLDFKVTQASEDDALEVYMQGKGEHEKLGEFALSETMDEFETFLLDLPSNLIGQLSKLQFKLADKNQNGFSAQLLLDNVFFTDQVETTALDLITGEGNATAETVIAAGAASLEPNNSTTFNSNLNLSWNAPNQGEPNKLIEIKIDGQFDRFLQVNYQGYEDLSPAADTYRFELKAGGPNLTFTTTPLPLQEMYFDKEGQDARVRFQDIDRDRLYGSRFLVTEFTYDENRRRNLNDTKSYLSYRWINAVDPEAATGRTVDLPEGVDDTAVFHRTLADGRGGFVRSKNIDLRLPGSFKTTFYTNNEQNNEFIYSNPTRNKGLVTWQFDPVNADGQISCYGQGTLYCKTDIVEIKGNNYSGIQTTIGKLQARGTATAPVEIKLNLNGFKEELRRIFTTGQIVENLEDKQIAATLPEIGLLQDANDGDVLYYRFTENGQGDQRPLIENPEQPGTFLKKPLLDIAIPVSKAFKEEFNGFLPKDMMEAQRNGTLAQWQARLDQLLDENAEALLAAVQEDFQPLNERHAAYTVTGKSLPEESSTDIKVSWFDLINKQASPTPGVALFNRFDPWLKPILIDPSITKPAKEWAMAQGIYRPKQTAYANINIGIHFNWEAIGGIPFAHFLANTVGQELGHNFGLNDAYLSTFGGGNVDPADIMGNYSRIDTNLAFAPRNLNLLQAALGFHESPYSSMTDRPFFRLNPSDNALLMYMKNWELPTSTTGLDISSYL